MTPILTQDYPLGNSDREHRRLIRQAEFVAPYTERLFREAGIAAGQRVLDLGSGVGDVAMLVASLVGPEGEVVAVERDARAIELLPYCRQSARNVTLPEQESRAGH